MKSWSKFERSRNTQRGMERDERIFKSEKDQFTSVFMYYLFRGLNINFPASINAASLSIIPFRFFFYYQRPLYW